MAQVKTSIGLSTLWDNDMLYCVSSNFAKRLSIIYHSTVATRLSKKVDSKR